MKLSLILTLLPFSYATIVPLASPASHFHLTSLDVAPTGKNITIDGVQTYVSLPLNGTFDKKTAILFLTDIFGLPSPDNLVLADQFAQQGFAVFAPDYLNGDAFPSDNSENLTIWAERHGEAQTIPPLLTVIDALKSRGVTQLAGTGYCFGGLYTTLLTQNNTLTVGTMSHPSSLSIPLDAELILNKSHVPIQLNNAQLDTELTPALAREIDGVLGGGRYKPGYERRQFDGVGHGFAVRANASDPIQVAAKEGAFNNSINWIKEHIRGH